MELIIILSIQAAALAAMILSCPRREPWQFDRNTKQGLK